MEYVAESERVCVACCLSGLVETGESVHLFLSFQEVCATHDVEGPREALVGELCAWELLTVMGLMGPSSEGLWSIVVLT